MRCVFVEGEVGFVGGEGEGGGGEEGGDEEEEDIELLVASLERHFGNAEASALG